MRFTTALLVLVLAFSVCSVAAASSNAAYDEGMALLHQHKFAEAADAFARSIDTNPLLAEGYFGVGFCKLVLKDMPGAAAAFETAIKLRPTYFEAMANLSGIYLSQGRHQDALTVLKKAHALKPDSLEINFALGTTLAYVDQLKESIEPLKYVITMKPDFAEAHLSLAAVYFALGDTRNAKKEFEILKSLNPKLADQLTQEMAKK